MLDISDWLWLIILIIYFITILGAIGVMLSENRNPIRSLGWVIALLCLPGVGLVFYLFFGRSLKGMHLISANNKRKLISRIMPASIDFSVLSLSPTERQLVKLSRKLCNSVLSVNNELEIFTEGSKKFEALKKDLSEARQSILLQYYIFSDDELGSEIADILKRKAREGVDVKVIYDYVGSFSAKRKFFLEMEEAGVSTHPFFKVTFPQLANRINWRNHRKIVVIDNAIGYIGGMNIADRYAMGEKNENVWRDTHFRVAGDIVESLLYSFIVDWNFRSQPDEMPFQEIPDSKIRSDVGMQLVTSGPTDNYENLALCFLKAIGSAKKSVFIQTPYFLPTDSLLHALEAAALAQVDVRIMIPRNSDSRLLKLASYSYITQCLKAGIKIYLYEPGMLHAKAMIIDDTIVSAGSTNFDFRSFENNFEANLFIYSSDVNRRMRDIFFEDIKSCTKITFSSWRGRPWMQRALESIVRLMSPIL